MKLRAAHSTELSEIFSSLQGEGPYLGVRQVFVRFGQCNMHCVYCDELSKMKKGSYRDFSQEEVLSRIDEILSREGQHHSVSLTGGEPLMYADFIEQILPELKNRGLKIYLETNGTFPRILKRLIHGVDIVAMDMKPPSSTGDRGFWDQHAEFLSMARSKDVFVKVVVTDKTSFSDLKKTIRIVEDVDRNIPFILQPESELVGINQKAIHRIHEFLSALEGHHLKDIRIVPQMHKIWGVR